MASALVHAEDGPVLANGRKLIVDLTSFAGGKQAWCDLTELAEAVRSSSMVLLLVCILVDFIGFMSYVLFMIGEVTDIWWAPMFGFFLQYMFCSRVITSLGVLEELLPFTDFLPTATLAWCITHLQVLEFVQKYLGMRPGGAPQPDQADAKKDD